MELAWNVVSLSLGVVQDVLQLTPVPIMELIFATLRKTCEVVQQLQTQNSQAVTLLELEAVIVRAVNDKV
jgi:hypothetical protein